MAARAAVAASTTVASVPPLHGRKSVLSRFDFNSHNGFGTGTIAGITSRFDVRIMADGDDLSLAYGNFCWGGDDSRTGTTTSIWIRAVIENPTDSKLYPVTFGGKVEIEIGPNGYVVSEPCGIRLTAGSRLRIRTYVKTAADGDAVPDTNKFVGSVADGHSAGNQTRAAAPTWATTNPYGYGPLAGFATKVDNAALPHVMLIGDSIMAGQNDVGSGTTVDRIGFVLRALQETCPFLHTATAGAAASSWADMNRSGGMKFPFAPSSTHAIICLGTNDGGTPESAADIENYLLTLGKEARRRGITSIYVCTISPQSTSSDGFTTLVNQTATSWSSGRRITANNWIRAGSPIDPTTLAAVAAGTVGATLAGGTNHPFNGYFETADGVESSRDSGKWKVVSGSGITDGTHPNNTGSDLMARAIDMTKFGQSTPVVIPGAPVAPDSVLGSDLYAWLKPESLGADGTAITSWTDSSGNARHFAQATGSKKPLVVANAINGFSAGRGDGVDDFLLASGNLPQPFTVFVVARLATTGGAHNKALFDGFSTGLSEQISTGRLWLKVNSNFLDGEADTTAWHSYTGIFDDTTSELRQDGVNPVTGTTGARTTSGMSIFGDTLGNTCGDWDIAELVVCARHPSAADRAAIEAWLRYRYGTA